MGNSLIRHVKRILDVLKSAAEVFKKHEKNKILLSIDSIDSHVVRSIFYLISHINLQIWH